MNLRMNDDQKIFSNHDALEITLTLQGVQNRDYHVRKQILVQNLAVSLMNGDIWEQIYN